MFLFYFPGTYGVFAVQHVVKSTVDFLELEHVVSMWFFAMHLEINPISIFIIFLLYSIFNSSYFKLIYALSFLWLLNKIHLEHMYFYIYILNVHCVFGTICIWE